MNRLLKLLPFLEQNCEEFIEIMKVNEIELDVLLGNIEDLERQLFIDTATWGLDIFEQELGIKTDKNKSFEERRNIIKSKFIKNDITHYEYSKNLLEIFGGYDVEIKFLGVIYFKVRSKGFRVSEFLEAYKVIQPAHLNLFLNFIEEFENKYFVGIGLRTRQILKLEVGM